MADKKFYIVMEDDQESFTLCYERPQNIARAITIDSNDFEALEKCIIQFGSDKGRFHSDIRGIKSRLLALIDEKILTLEYHDKDQNAIYYADGNVVCVGDMWQFKHMEDDKDVAICKRVNIEGQPALICEKYDITSVINIHGSLGYLTMNGTMPMPFVCNLNIKWDGNRMTNVKKVDVKL